MRVTHIRIRNILGIESLEVEPGKFTILRGPNASGKTSVLEALRAALGGGHDASLLRRGAKKGEVVLLLDDGTEVKKVITEERSALAVQDGASRDVKSPQAFLNQLLNAASFNPVAFIAAPAKERVKILLEAVPPEVDHERLAAIAKEASGLPVELPEEELDPFALVARVRKGLFDERTGVNRAAKEKRATAETVSRGLPPASDLATDWPRKLKQFEAELEQMTTEAGEASLSAERARAAALVAIEQETGATLEKIRDEHDKRIKELEEALGEARRSRSEALAIAANEGEVRKLEAEQAHRVATKGLQERLSPKRSDLAAKVAEARAKVSERERSGEQRRLVATLWQDVERLEQRSGKLTTGLEALDGMAAGLLSRLPVDGLQVVDGELAMHGIPFDRLSSSQQIWIAVEVAKARPGKLPLVVCDGMERLDEETFAAFRAAFEATELQAIVTRVTDEAELKVEVSA